MRIGEGECRVAESILDWIDREAAFFRAASARTSRLARWNLEAGFDRETMSDARRLPSASTGKTSGRCRRMSVGIGVEEMIGPRIVLVHAALDQPHPEHAR